MTPLRNGINLIAKEYVAAQNPDDPGVLVLSRFAGAAPQLDGALIMNPYDTKEVAEDLQAALEMPLEERRERWSGMMEGFKRNDTGHGVNNLSPPTGREPLDVRTVSSAA